VNTGHLAVGLILVAMAAVADAADGDHTRILVTFADPSMTRAAVAGPARPGYRRTSSSYLVSIAVKRAANRLAEEYDLEIVDEWPILPLKVHCLVYGVDDGIAVDALLQRIRERPEVESAQLMNEFNVSTSASLQNADPHAGLQHNLETLELVKAHAWSLGAGSRVTIIDTGADFHHPDLEKQIRHHSDFVGDDKEAFTSDAHGTAVAGIIAAASDNGIGMTGIAPAAELTVLRACWYPDFQERAVCNSFTLAKALTFAVESDTHVINLSLGGPSDALLERLVRVALERGIIVVAAAPAGGRKGFPVSVSGVIAVGSENDPDDVTVRAPGDSILVPIPGGGFDFASGSSLSAAQVSGIVALLVARQPGLSRTDVTRLLVDSRPADRDDVNACRALAELLQLGGCDEKQSALHQP
jgi:hypothetical protein